MSIKPRYIKEKHDYILMFALKLKKTQSELKRMSNMAFILGKAVKTKENKEKLNTVSEKLRRFSEDFFDILGHLIELEELEEPKDAT